MSAPDNSKLNEIAEQAERDLNSYRSKVGLGRDRATDYEPAGVTYLEASRFPGASVKYGDDLVTNKGYDRRMPPDEGGAVDDRGRFIRGHAFEGVGGPEDKMGHIYQHNPGGMEEATIKKWGLDPRKLEGEMVDRERSNLVSADDQPHIGGDPPRRGEPLERGWAAGRSNLGIPPEDHGRELPRQGAQGAKGVNHFRGSEYYVPESVPDSNADQMAVPPESVTETSKRPAEA